MLCIFTLLQISPGVTSLLRSFEKLLIDPTSVFRMAELARMLGERRLCKLQVDIMSLVHTTYCIEHEKLEDVLRHFREMVSFSLFFNGILSSLPTHPQLLIDCVFVVIFVSHKFHTLIKLIMFVIY